MLLFGGISDGLYKNQEGISTLTYTWSWFGGLDELVALYRPGGIATSYSGES